MVEDDLEELRERTDHGTRLDEADNELAHKELVDKLLTELEAMERGEKQKTVSVWDEHVAATIRVLESQDDLREEVVSDLSDALGVEVEDADRSTVIRLALRLGFQTATPEVMDALEDAVKKRAVQNI